MKNCCFTGHRKIAQQEFNAVKQRLSHKISELIEKGVSDFYCGGAIGFDMMAGFTVLTMKQLYEPVRLIMALPCRRQDAKWQPEEKSLPTIAVGG